MKMPLSATAARIELVCKPVKNGESTIEQSGISFRTSKEILPTGAFEPSDVKQLTDFGFQLSAMLPIMVEQEIADIDGTEIFVSFENVHCLYNPDLELGLTRWLPELCPYTLQIEARNIIGSEDFKYDYSFYEGNQRVLIQRRGCFVVKGSNIYCLPNTYYKLVEQLDKFNSLPSIEKTRNKTLETFAEISLLAKSLGANLDKYLATTHVVMPTKVGIQIEQDAEGRVSFLPEFDGIPQDELSQQFKQFGDAQPEYQLATSDGGRLRIVINDEIRQALQAMRKVDRLSGKAKDKALTATREIFGQMDNLDCVDLKTFGPRVKGVGPYVFQPKPFIRTYSPGFLNSEGADIFASDSTGKRICDVGIEAVDSDGNTINIPISDAAELETTIEAVTSAERQGHTCVELSDENNIKRRIPLVPELSKGLAAVERQFAKKKKSERELPERISQENSDRRYLLIYDNSEALDYIEQSADVSAKDIEGCELPSSLKKAIGINPLELKDFQKAGVAWLQRCFRSGSGRAAAGRRGVLLADDMGLGKTLQILTFLAWFIETGYKENLAKDKPPYEPILVIAPVILLQNWKQEISRFFEYDGANFEPFTVLYGDQLKDFKITKAKGREYEHGGASLDTDRMRRNRLIITNFDTVKNYQHSFAQVEWSVVVVDEAQEIKEPNTTITWALKSLNALYRIAMTGTPVENCLADLWNIMDFAQPGILGTRKLFRTEYESDLAEISDEERAKRAQSLRERLLYQSPNAYLVRRTKEGSLDGLPAKNILVRRSMLSPEQEKLHLEILSQVNAEQKEKKGMHLVAIQRLSKIYQHLDLDEGDLLRGTPQDYLKRSPKLRDTISLLKEIHQRGEKVLIFAISVKMQAILKIVVDKEFGLNISVINGSTSSKASSTGKGKRLEAIDSFGEKQGFNAMILSPDVAGVGLNIVAANNVIHYGRWWNPAKESQATDRAYRIGQTKDVNVYYPISVSEKFTTFDEKLHLLLENKKQIASDFLVPSDSLTISGQDLFNEIDLSTSKQSGGSSATQTCITIDKIGQFEPTKFKSAIAALLAKAGWEVKLTPLSQNLGIDVIATKGSEVQLCQCRVLVESGQGQSFDLSIAKQAVEYYRLKVLGEGFREARYSVAAYTAGNIDKDIKKECERSKIDLNARDSLAKLLKQHQITNLDVEIQDTSRNCSVRSA